MKIEITQPSYPKKFSTTPRFQRPTDLKVSKEVPEGPGFDKDEHDPRAVGMYLANYMSDVIDAYWAHMKGGHKEVFENFILIEEPELPSQAGGEHPNFSKPPEGNPSPLKEQPSTPPANPSPPPSGGDEATEKQIRYISVLMNKALKMKKYDVADWFDKYLDARKYKSSHDLNRHEAKEVIDKLLSATGEANDGQ